MRNASTQPSYLTTALKTSIHHQSSTPALMKLVLILSLTLFFSQLRSQNMALSAGLENTVAGNELHLSTGYVTRNNWAVGVFHQMKISNISVESKPDKTNADWSGLYFNAPIANTKKINLLLQIRTGMSEHKFLVIVPSLETQLNLSKLVSVSIGSSLRYTHPAFSLKTIIHPFTTRK